MMHATQSYTCAGPAFTSIAHLTGISPASHRHLTGITPTIVNSTPFPSR
ncbi:MULTISPECIES: hypothetical protein [Burkholderia]|nr:MULTISPECIES: hypothetical protein [Burkholderia]